MDGDGWQGALLYVCMYHLSPYRCCPQKAIYLAMFMCVHIRKGTTTPPIQGHVLYVVTVLERQALRL